VGRGRVGAGAGTLINDLSYFLRRASDERTAALHAKDPRVRRVHLEMAERYEERVRGMTAHHERIYVPLVEHA
jgi:hypothetical protein